MTKIAIIIVNFNGEKNITACLESLRDIVLPSDFKTEVIVVDNASSDDSVQMIKKRFKDVELIENKENTGFTGGNNIGIEYSITKDFKYILLLNSDTIVDKNFLKELVFYMEENKEVGVSAPKIYFEKGYEYHKDRYRESERGKVFWYAGGIMDFKNVIGIHRGVDEVDTGQYNKVSDTDFTSGCCMLIRAEVLKKIGYLNEKYFLYYEDAELCQRIKQNGYKIIFNPNSFIWHKNAGSAGGSGSKLQDYYITRNRLLFGMAFARSKTKLSLIKESIGLLINGRYWQKRGIVDFYRMRFGKGSFKA